MESSIVEVQQYLLRPFKLKSSKSIFKVIVTTLADQTLDQVWKSYIFCETNEISQFVKCYRQSWELNVTLTCMPFICNKLTNVHVKDIFKSPINQYNKGILVISK